MREKTIAVLPFVNMSASEENEYFSDGMTEEIINALARIRSLRVTSRTSSFFFKNKNIPVRQIGQELKVNTILEGSVRLAGDTLRITAQLIQAEEDFHFWSETWDRKLENIFEIQDEISLLIADKLREHMGHFEIQEHLVNKQTDNITAYELFLKARFYFRKWNPTDVKTAMELYEKALELDPRHAESVLGLADCYGFMATAGFMPVEAAWGKAAELTYKGLELNDQLADGHYQLANLHFFTACDYEGALKEGLLAIALNPNFIEAQQYLAFLYTLAGEKGQARQHLDMALEIDPISQETLFFSAYFDYMTENYPEALRKLDKCLDHNPRNIPAHSVKCYCLIKMGRYEEALHYFDHLPQDIVVPGDKLGITALAYAHKNDLEHANQFLDELIRHAATPEGFRSSSFLYFMYAVLGEKDKAFEWVREARDHKFSLLLLHFADPMVNALKKDPRFLQYQKEIFHLPEPQKIKKTSKDLLDAATTKAYVGRLIRFVEKEKPYLDPGLSLRSLASAIDIHPNQLSWLLNESIGKNFNEFVNYYRVEAFKQLATDSTNAHLSLLGLAYESGFNSKTVFNTYFKKETGLTPKQFLKEQE
ncbi:MAG: helix-turn-helix domain-containing protein [Saprospiraceae bacterium]|nr:helix-turn-helix domain-containing protein [Saprospiraceae bacterium]MCB9325497.1 helix-turn-helix domain-containing protein [Lewinellaceae bacterium]